MKGSTSIKAVLPAVWGTNDALRADPWFKAYARIENGRAVDPYQTLPKLEIFDRAEVVNEGTGGDMGLPRHALRRGAECCRGEAGVARSFTPILSPRYARDGDHLETLGLVGRFGFLCFFQGNAFPRVRVYVSPSPFQKRPSAKLRCTSPFLFGGVIFQADASLSREPNIH
jgi:hypothetical protein